MSFSKVEELSQHDHACMTLKHSQQIADVRSHQADFRSSRYFSVHKVREGLASASTGHFVGLLGTQCPRYNLNGLGLL
jgi:hypothetical protein